jgi:hypothetical protein
MANIREAIEELRCEVLTAVKEHAELSDSESSSGQYFSSETKEKRAKILGVSSAKEALDRGQTEDGHDSQIDVRSSPANAVATSPTNPVNSQHGSAKSAINMPTAVATSPTNSQHGTPNMPSSPTNPSNILDQSAISTHTDIRNTHDAPAASQTKTQSTIAVQTDPHATSALPTPHVAAAMPVETQARVNNANQRNSDSDLVAKKPVEPVAHATIGAKSTQTKTSATAKSASANTLARNVAHPSKLPGKKTHGITVSFWDKMQQKAPSQTEQAVARKGQRYGTSTRLSDGALEEFVASPRTQKEAILRQNMCKANKELQAATKARDLAILQLRAAERKARYVCSMYVSMYVCMFM